MMDFNSDIATLEEDIQDFNIEKDVRTSLKTQEELDKLTVDETLNDIDRAVFILSSGQEVQCVSVIRHLPKLIRGWQNECIRRVIPKMKELLHTAGLDAQMAATEVFTTIAKDELLPIPVYTQHFLRTIITNVNTKDPIASNAWLDTLISVINFMPRETVRREVLGLAIAKGQLSQPTASRLSCCSILGAVCSKFDTHVVKKDIVHTVKQLCQDVEHNVRACMCKHLHTIAATLGVEETRKLLLDEVLELAGDEESQVREAALEALLNMTKLLDDECLSQSVVPLVCKFCEQAVQTEDHTLLFVAGEFGRLCCNMTKNYNAEQRSWLLMTYRHLCTLGRPPAELGPPEGQGDLLSVSNLPLSSTQPPPSPNRPSVEKQEEYIECRRLCAYNFPALTLFCSPDAFEAELLNTASLFCSDNDSTVRKHFAAGIHEVAQALEAQAHLIHNHLVLLLRERNVPSVLEACLKRLPDTLTAVVVRGNLIDNQPHGVSELIGALLSAISRLEQQWTSAWRPLETLVTHLRRLPDVLTSDQIYYKFVPVVFKLLTTNRYLPVREAAACTVCVFIRHNKKQTLRNEMCDRLIQDLCYARSFRNRLLFFEACRHMMALFSRTFFKEHFFEHVLVLFNDPVPNVRLCLCKILPSMKALLKLPRDRALHGQLESSVRKLLSSEKDRDVSSTIRATILELDRTEVSMESLTQHLLLDADLQDQRKEEEERLLVAKEEKSRDEDARSLKSHASSHSSSSVSKSRSEKPHKLKKRSTTSFQSSTTSSSLKVNGSKEKEKSKSFQSLPSTNSSFLQGKDNVISSSSSGSLSVLYNMAPSNPHPPRNIVNHFSHTYLTGAANTASQGPSTALGHKGPQYPGHSLTQSRNSPSAPTSAFMGSLSQLSTSAPQASSKPSRKSERRRTTELTHSSSALDPSLIAEPRTRKNSAGSVSSTGSGGRVRHLPRRKSTVGSPLSSTSNNKTKKDKTTR